MINPYTMRDEFLRKAIKCLLIPLVVALLACSTKPGPTASPLLGGDAGGGASEKIGNGSKLLMDSIENPASPLHLSYAGQANINPNFPHQSGSKPTIGAVAMEADISADEVVISKNQGGKKTSTNVKKDDELNWAMAKLEVMGPLVGPNLDLAFGGIAAVPAGSDNVGGVAADKYDIDTGRAPATTQAALQVAASMLGAKIKFDGMKGAVWVDRASGRLVKFNFDTQFSDHEGNTWKEHHQALITSK